MLNPAASIAEALESNGFVVIEQFASDGVIESLLKSLDSDLLGERAGTRQLHQRVPFVSEFLRAEPITRWVEELIPGGFPVRSILFDKTPETNWRVAWHQDLSICVKERHHLPGYKAWSLKEGIPHVQPPTRVLERMLTVRLHLDECGEDNGPLRVIPGSHRSGQLSADEIAAWRSKGLTMTCMVPRGGAVIMRPLLLHSSSPATNPTHRRVLHIEFASEALPEQLEWIS